MVKAASLLAGLPEGSVLVVDTAPIIYWLEGHARFAARFAEVFHAAESGAAYPFGISAAIAGCDPGRDAIRVGATALTTHDKALARVAGLRVLGPT